MKQFIIYRVANQRFAISISLTSKIIALDSITSVPESSEYIMGVAEVEGEILPILDLSKRFFKKELENIQDAQILVILWEGKEIGLAVDEVLGITDYEESQIDTDIEKITKLGVSHNTTPISSFIRTKEGIVLELNMDQFMRNANSLEISNLLEMDGAETKDVSAENGHEEPDETNEND